MAGTMIKGEHREDEGGRWAGPQGQLGFMGWAMGSHGQTEEQGSQGSTSGFLKNGLAAFNHQVTDKET